MANDLSKMLMMRFITLLVLSMSLVSAQIDEMVKNGETIIISIQGVSQNEQMRINSMYVVSDDGFIHMWKIEKVKVAGLNPTEIAQSIAKKYREMGIYKNPTIQVQRDLTGHGDAKAVNTRGAVAKVGRVLWMEKMTIFDVLDKAGGVTNLRGLKEVRIHRNGKILTHNLFKEDNESIRIYPGDTIEVPTTQNMTKEKVKPEVKIMPGDAIEVPQTQNMENVNPWKLYSFI